MSIGRNVIRFRSLVHQNTYHLRYRVYHVYTYLENTNKSDDYSNCTLIGSLVWIYSIRQKYDIQGIKNIFYCILLFQSEQHHWSHILELSLSGPLYCHSLTSNSSKSSKICKFYESFIHFSTAANICFTAIIAVDRQLHWTVLNLPKSLIIIDRAHSTLTADHKLSSWSIQVNSISSLTPFL